MYKLDKETNQEVRNVVKQYASYDLRNYKYEGLKMPNFNFTDINGYIYNEETTRDKIVVIKCWFLGCQACREEIPFLNTVTKQYHNRKDILFISLIFDSKTDIEAFLKKNKFTYAPISNQEDYLEKTMKFVEYPTHIIVNKQGLITKVVNSADELALALKKEAAKK